MQTGAKISFTKHTPNLHVLGQYQKSDTNSAMYILSNNYKIN